MAYTDTKTDLVINKMTLAQYNSLLESGQITDSELYFIIDDNDRYYYKNEVYNKDEIDALLSNVSVDLTGYATEEWVQSQGYLTTHQDISNLASTSYVDTKVADLVNSAPETLDTLGELATALQENKNVTQTLDSAITNKLDKSSIVYSETEPENPVEGMIWLKKII